MTLRRLISLSPLFLAWQAVCAQSADDYFHGGAQFYISNNIANARQVVETGLKLYPDDIKLKKLEELLKRQQQQQQQQQQSQQNQQNQSNQQQSQQQPQKSQQAQNQSAQQNERQPQEQPQPAQSPPTQPDQKSGQKGNEAQATATAAQEMTPEEAQRLLDAQKGNEQFLQLKPKEPSERPHRVLKDW